MTQDSKTPSAPFVLSALSELFVVLLVSTLAACALKRVIEKNTNSDLPVR